MLWTKENYFFTSPMCKASEDLTENQVHHAHLHTGTDFIDD